MHEYSLRGYFVEGFSGLYEIVISEKFTARYLYSMEGTMIILLSVLLVVSSIIWYAFFYYLLYSIKKDVNLSAAALILLLLISAGIVTCPYFHYMGALPMYNKLQAAYKVG